MAPRVGTIKISVFPKEIRITLEGSYVSKKSRILLVEYASSTTNQDLDKLVNRFIFRSFFHFRISNFQFAHCRMLQEKDKQIVVTITGYLKNRINTINAVFNHHND
jgi:hypothetical protein